MEIVSKTNQLKLQKRKIHLIYSIGWSLTLKESLLKSLKPEVVKGTAENFEKWWQSLPEKRKVNKKGCLEKWKSKKLDDISKKIISWTATMKKTREWLEGFNPSPEVIINQERWNDNPKSPTQIRGAL